MDERRAAVEQELRAAAHLEHVVARQAQLSLPRRRRRRRRRRREQRGARVGRRYVRVRTRAARVGRHRRTPAIPRDRSFITDAEPFLL